MKRIYSTVKVQSSSWTYIAGKLFVSILNFIYIYIYCIGKEFCEKINIKHILLLFYVFKDTKSREFSDTYVYAVCPMFLA